MGNLHKHFSEMIGWRHERKFVVGGQYDYAAARKAYNRASRRDARREIQVDSRQAVVEGCDETCSHCIGERDYEEMRVVGNDALLPVSLVPLTFNLVSAFASF